MCRPRRTEERNPYSAALYDPAAGTWTTLPDAPVAGAADGGWEVAGGRVVNLDPAGGAQFSLATGRWLPLPPMPAGKQPGSLAWANAAGGDLALRQGWALHVPTGTWLRLPPLPGTVGRVDPAAVVRAGDRLFVWGGFAPGRAEGETVSRPGWTWRPGTALRVDVEVGG